MLGFKQKPAGKHKSKLSEHKGLWYEIHKETIDLTVMFYNKELKLKSEVIDYYNRMLNTNKVEAYIKKEISNKIFSLLKKLHSLRVSGLADKNILISKNPINKFVVRHFLDKYRVKFQINWIKIPQEWFSLFLYYGRLFKQLIHRGVVFNKPKKTYKLSKEAIWGFYRPTLKDDMLIDGFKFNLKDILILDLGIKDYHRIRASKEARERGFEVVSVPKISINITKDIFNLFYFYIIVPLRIYFYLFFKQQLYIFYYLLLFHQHCFPIEILMNLYCIKGYISTRNWGDVAETIIFNKYGAKNVIFNWSDLTSYKPYYYAFIAHNIYFTWGDIHYIYHSDNYFVDMKVNIGCVYKREYDEAVKNKEKIIAQIPGLDKRKKIVTFFDTSFSPSGHFTNSFYLEYIKMIKKFCATNRDINVLLKPKQVKQALLKTLGEDLEQYNIIWQELIGYDNFIELEDVRWSAEEIIAISDLCINMGMNSPATIALICGKDALYFDNTGDIYHPFAKKYKNIIVFEDRDLLFKQIDNILNGKFNCKDIISEREIREYDAFADNNALERLRDSLYELTSSKS